MSFENGIAFLVTVAPFIKNTPNLAVSSDAEIFEIQYSNECSNLRNLSTGDIQWISSTFEPSDVPGFIEP